MAPDASYDDVFSGPADLGSRREPIFAAAPFGASRSARRPERARYQINVVLRLVSDLERPTHLRRKIHRAR